MSTAPRQRAVPRIALRPDEAAVALGVSRSTFYERVLPELRCLTVGRVRLVTVAELERWAGREARRLSEVRR
jgi:excisionase family DNA binding protein